MIKVHWNCPECGIKNSNNADEIENYAQFCDGCGKEFFVETDDLVVLAHKVVSVEE